MSLVFSYIATKSTVDPYLPTVHSNQAIFMRNVSDGFMALAGGHLVVGQLAQFPVQRSVANHLLCDGREVAKADFPELFEFIGDSQGASTDPDYFVLPNYLGTGAIEPAEVADTVVETAIEGTVSTPDPTPPVPGDPPEERPIYGPVDSGGRFRHLNSTL